MIPNHPNFTNLTEAKDYPATGLVRPPLPKVSVTFALLGPVQLNDSRGKLNQRYWMVTQENGKVFIRGSE